MQRKVAKMMMIMMGSFHFHFIFTMILTLMCSIALSTTTTITSTTVNASLPSSLNPSPPPQPQRTTPFRPSVVVVIGILFTVFSITFLLLLYVKHCKGGTNFYNNHIINRPGSSYPTTTDRKNSGIDPTVIDSLPIFRFASLRGQKEGLECAVCLNKFELTEVLRLLPKCKHAFHVECVDTWLDAHSTCPLCRYRVDPEDILLVDDRRSLISRSTRSFRPPNSTDQSPATTSSASVPSSPRQRSNIRTLGRHSSAGESRRNPSLLEVIVEKPGQVLDRTTSLMTRRSLDSWRSFNRKASSNSKNNSNSGSSSSSSSTDRPRKDGLLLEDKSDSGGGGSGGGGGGGGTEHRRLEHRIILSGSENGGPQERWSDVEASDLLYLRTEMILEDSRRLVGSRGSRPFISRQGNNSINNTNNNNNGNNNNNKCSGGRNVINERSVSEITGMSRFRSSNERQQNRQRHEVGGVVSRWKAWISQSQPPGGGGAAVGGGGEGVASTTTAAADVPTSTSSSS